MKTIQELADEGVLFKSAEAELVKQQLFEIIKEASVATRIGRQLVDIINMREGSTLDFILADKDSMQVVEVGEGAEIPLKTEAYTKLQVTPLIYGVRIAVTNRMIEDANWDIIQRNLATAGRKMGEKEDELILGSFDNSTDGFPSQSGHSITTSGTELAIADIATGMAHVEEHDYHPNVMVLSEKQVSELRQIDTFVEADKVGDRRVFENGFVGKIFGMETVISSAVSDDSAYILDSKEAGVLVLRRPLTVERLADPLRDLTNAVVTQRMSAKVLRAMAGVKITVS